MAFMRWLLETNPSEGAMRLAKDKRETRVQTVNKMRSRIRTLTWSNENKVRVIRAEHALHLYLKDGQRPAVAIHDILSDLRHYCDAYGINYLKQDEIANRNYAGQVLELI
jgi:hypothetical protein